jgi:hypothetical protein
VAYEKPPPPLAMFPSSLVLAVRRDPCRPPSLLTCLVRLGELEALVPRCQSLATRSTWGSCFGESGVWEPRANRGMGDQSLTGAHHLTGQDSVT